MAYRGGKDQEERTLKFIFFWKEEHTFALSN